MALKNRIGFFFIFCSGLALLVFWASVKTPGEHFNLEALLIGAASGVVGWALATAKRPAPPPGPPPEEAPPPPAPARKKRRAGSGLFRQPPPSLPPPAPPEKKKARGGRFRSK